MRMTVIQSLSQLIETTPPSFADIVSSIPNSVPVFILMPQQKALKQPLNETPAQVIQKLAEVRFVEVSCCWPI